MHQCHIYRPSAGRPPESPQLVTAGVVQRYDAGGHWQRENKHNGHAEHLFATCPGKLPRRIRPAPMLRELRPEVCSIWPMRAIVLPKFANFGGIRHPRPSFFNLGRRWPTLAETGPTLANLG